MFVFIDESGDVDVPGITPYFALSAVVFATAEDKNGIEGAILQLRQEWGKKLREGEFKFVWLDDEGRKKFFVKVGDLPFKYSSCVLLKEGLGRQWKEKGYVYERVIRELVDGLTPYFREVDAAQDKPLKVRVVADEHEDPDYWRLLKARFYSLRSKDGSGMVKSVKPGKSVSSRLLQFADLVCGASRWDTNDYRLFVAAQCLERRLLP
jgi:hypothetical protein